MKFYSTNHKLPDVSLSEAVIKGLAPDNGLYMPERIEILPKSFFDSIEQKSLHEVAFVAAQTFFGEDIPGDKLRAIVEDTLAFDTPVVKITDKIHTLELFHGPTAAFKDVGARFMARMLAYFLSESDSKEEVTVLVATSGDTGSAVANGFLGVDGINVVVLYPKGKVSEIQEMQFTTLGQNITAIEVDGTFDDCQRLVKSAFLDQKLNKQLKLTSANSINVARFLPQSFYYFYAYAQMRRQGKADELVVCVPSGNFGNLTAGLFACRMGLPIKRFIAANNLNDIFYQYLKTGVYAPRASVTTIANAMDVGDPSNFVRILDLYGSDIERIRADVSAYRFDDGQIRECIKRVFNNEGYLLDPHGACGYLALEESLRDEEVGVFLETAHPAKFLDTVEPIIGEKVEIPATLKRFMDGEKQTVELSNRFEEFKEWLMS